MKHLLLIGFSLLIFFSGCTLDPHTYATIETDYGTMKVQLYNTTPQHRDNFIKLANEGFYDELLFHRVIDGFMIQGGDPDSKNAPQGKMLGMGGPGYETPAEISSENVHYRGALAAARNNNPQKNSSGSQFYIVHGKAVDDTLLDRIEQQREFTYTEEQRSLYKDIGGAPILDGEYTVFGQLMEGYDVLDKIALTQVGRADRPVQDVKMKVRID